MKHLFTMGRCEAKYIQLPIADLTACFQLLHFLDVYKSDILQPAELIRLIPLPTS